MAKFHRPDRRGSGRGGRPGASPSRGRSDAAAPVGEPRSPSAEPARAPAPTRRANAPPSGKPGSAPRGRRFDEPPRERDAGPERDGRRPGGPSKGKPVYAKPGGAPRGRSPGASPGGGFDKPRRERDDRRPAGKPTGKPYRARPGSQAFDRASSPRPPSERPQSERPRSERTPSERTRSERPSERPFDKPRGKRPAGPPRAEGRSEARAAPRRDRPLADAPFRRELEAALPQPNAVEPVARRDDELWVYGNHATAAAIANPRRRIRRLVALADAAAALNATLAQAQARLPIGPLPEIVSREILEALLPPGAVHQGVALAAAPLPAGDIEDVIAALAEPGTEPGAATQIVVLLDQVTDPHNIGAVLRSAAAFGAVALVLPEHGAPEPTGTLAKAASGALELVPLVRVVNLARTLDRLKEAGFWCIGLDEAAPQTLAESRLTGRVALVLGAEGEGMRRLTRERCDILVRLPTRGALASLNVSNAAAIALYELTRG
ncbi:MAG: rRNA methylase [Rhodospirillales bacterium]|nr:rRNA methylase [Rhodospirillales bacterium]